MTRYLTTFSAVLVLICALASLGSGQDRVRTQSELRSQLAGRWTLAIPEDRARTIVNAAIERAVSEMNSFLQGITRNQLRERTPINRWIEVRFPAEQRIAVTFDTNYTYETRAGYAQDFAMRDGTDVNVNQFFRGEQLEQVFVASLGRRWNVMRVSADGASLSIAATVQGPMMPVPVSFTLPYRKN